MTAPPPIALVTGASRGLGRGIALELARAGWQVAINYLGNQAAAEDCAAACRAVAGDGRQRFLPLQGDVALAADRVRLTEAVWSAFGGCDALVNNAGVAPTVRADVLDAGEESFDRLIGINLKGPYFLTQAIARRWLSERAPTTARYRSVVFVTSVSAQAASTTRGDYCISKAGTSMSASLWAARLAPEGILVYEVRPGIMHSDMTAAVRTTYDALIAQGLVPQNRWGTPADVGQAVAALVTGAFPFSTGTVLDVDGGLTLRRL